LAAAIMASSRCFVAFTVEVRDARGSTHGEAKNGYAVILVPPRHGCVCRCGNDAVHTVRAKVLRELRDIHLRAAHGVGKVAERDVHDSHGISAEVFGRLVRRRTRRHLDAIDSALV